MATMCPPPSKRSRLNIPPVIPTLMQGIKLHSADLESDLESYLEEINDLEQCDPKELGTDILEYLLGKSVPVGVCRDTSNLIEQNLTNFQQPPIVCQLSNDELVNELIKLFRGSKKQKIKGVLESISSNLATKARGELWRSLKKEKVEDSDAEKILDKLEPLKHFELREKDFKDNSSGASQETPAPACLGPSATSLGPATSPAPATSPSPGSLLDEEPEVDPAIIFFLNHDDAVIHAILGHVAGLGITPPLLQGANAAASRNALLDWLENVVTSVAGNNCRVFEIPEPTRRGRIRGFFQGLTSNQVDNVEGMIAYPAWTAAIGNLSAGRYIKISKMTQSTEKLQVNMKSCGVFRTVGAI